MIANLWESGPRRRPLRPGEALQPGQAVTVADEAYVFGGWMHCGQTRYALLDCGRCPLRHVAEASIVMVEVGADDDGKQETHKARTKAIRTLGRAKRNRG